MSPETLSSLPAWAQQERKDDFAWLSENLPVFWPVAQHGLETSGLGALVIDTSTVVRHENGLSHPFLYVPENALKEKETFADAVRMIHAYDPQMELVTVLLKPQDRVSTYRIRVPPAR